MLLLSIRFRTLTFASCVFVLLHAGCVAFEPVLQSKVEEINNRPWAAILPIGFDIDITQLSAVKSVDEPLSAEEEARQLAQVLAEVCQEARWLLLSRLATGYGFRFVSLEESDALAGELALKPGTVPTPAEVSEFRKRLGADLVIAVSILDYGKVRWQWLAAGMFADIAWETVVIGLATAWNPAIILGNVSFELLTSTPLWFGGGYLFGVAMRPVRVEARAFETVEGWPIWQTMEESIYAWGALKYLPEKLRNKKEAQLHLNLAETMESLGDTLTEEGYLASHLKTRYQAIAP